VWLVVKTTRSSEWNVRTASWNAQADATDLDFFFYQLHRDTRLQELVGDAVIYREQDSEGGEVIRQANRPGGILTAEICVLDDISRAPGEARGYF
jgi:MoxR-like ATPase